jgi:hypothetical protein
MKLLNRISAIGMSFCLAWGLTRQLIGKGDVSTANTIQVSLGKSAASLPSKAVSNKLAAKALVEAFRNNAPRHWLELWESFAENASEEELQTLVKSPKEVATWVGGSVTEVLQILAEEELSLRLDSPVLCRHGVAALAEIDAEAAWKVVGQVRASMVSAAVLRTLAITDPAAALEKLRQLGMERGPEWNGENDVIHGPLESIFAAWTRRDSAAAMAAAESLPDKQELTAQQEIALTLAYSKGAAALQYLVDKDLLSVGRRHQVNALLRAIFSQPPTAARAAILTEHPEIFSEVDIYDFLGPWLRMDREGARAFIGTRKLDVRGLGLLVRQDPAAALQVALQNGFGAAKNYPPRWAELYQHYPVEVRALAEQQGCWGAVEQRLAEDTAKMNSQPATRLRGMLDRISQEGLEKAVRSLPLIGKSPAEQLESYLDCAKRFLPEAVPEMEDFISQAAGMRIEPRGVTLAAPLSEELFAYDPAAAAQRLLEKPLGTWDGWHAVDYWAPYDFPAAAAWVASLPDGQAKHYAEIALLEHHASISGEAVLTTLLAEDPTAYYKAKVSSFPSRKLTNIWKKGLRSVANSGGDWQAWLNKLPASYMADGVTRTQFRSLEKELQESGK